MKWRIPLIDWGRPTIGGGASKAEIYAGVHGVPWGMSDTDAPDAFAKHFRAACASRRDHLWPGTKFCRREIEMRGGRLYGIDMDLWWLEFGSERPGRPFHLYWVTVLRLGVYGRSVDDDHRQVMHEITRRYGRYDRHTCDSVYCWDWSDANDILATHYCMIGYPGNHVVITFINRQMDQGFRLSMCVPGRCDAPTRAMLHSPTG